MALKRPGCKVPGGAGQGGRGFRPRGQGGRGNVLRPTCWPLRILRASFPHQRTTPAVRLGPACVRQAGRVLQVAGERIEPETADGVLGPRTTRAVVNRAGIRRAAAGARGRGTAGCRDGAPSPAPLGGNPLRPRAADDGFVEAGDIPPWMRRRPGRRVPSPDAPVMRQPTFLHWSYSKRPAPAAVAASHGVRRAGMGGPGAVLRVRVGTVSVLGRGCHISARRCAHYVRDHRRPPGDLVLLAGAGAKRVPSPWPDLLPIPLVADAAGRPRRGDRLQVPAAVAGPAGHQPGADRRGGPVREWGRRPGPPLTAQWVCSAGGARCRFAGTPRLAAAPGRGDHGG